MNFVFDFGRVLFRWRPEMLLREVLPERASDEASARHWVSQIFQGYGGDWAEFDRGTVSPHALAQRIAARTGLRVDEAKAVIEAVPAELQPLADSVALLQRVRDAGRRTFYLSNMPAPYADHLEATHAFVRGFEAGVFSARVGYNKPEPEIFALAQARFGVPADSLLFLDDHAPNVQAARQAGWQALLFTDAAQAEQDLRAAGWWLD